LNLYAKGRRSFQLRTTGARRNHFIIKHVQRPLQPLHPSTLGPFGPIGASSDGISKPEANCQITSGLPFIQEQSGKSRSTSRLAILIVGAMPGFCCVSSNKQERRCNGCPVHSISKRNYKASSRNLSFLTFVSPAFVVSSVSQLSPAQSASRIPKPCDWLRKIRAHAGPDRATVARPDRGEPAPT
jgi:hypothetical protein